MTEGPEIGAVVDDLTRIVEACHRQRSALGIFPAMYRRVTMTIRDGIEHGLFDDGEKVERLVSVFAGLYVEAIDTRWSGARPAAAWDLAFDFAERGRGSIGQHLLLGMNAHINLDLGIATARVCAPDNLASFRVDFVRVNDVLFALVDALQDGLGEVSPWMRRLDRLGLGLDEATMRSGIALARSRAWTFSEELVTTEAADRAGLIEQRDVETRRLGQLLCHRASVLHLANRVVAWRECRDLGQVIDSVGAARIDVHHVLAAEG